MKQVIVIRRRAEIARLVTLGTGKMQIEESKCVSPSTYEGWLVAFFKKSRKRRKYEKNYFF
jgi:hypothetical protein